MPELAEVETVRRVLSSKLINKTITDINVIYPKMIENNITYFKDNLINNKLLDIKRKGKYLIFEFQNHYLISHLRMEGKFFVKENYDQINKHEHILLTFDNNIYLIYHDVRKFGRMKLITKSDYQDYFSKLGLEPSALTLDYLKDKLKGKTKNIKTLLLDQSIIAGLGNIYANEVLYASKINPYKKGKDLNNSEILSIIDNSQRIISKAIIEGGTTIKSYTSSLGVTGNYQKYLKVHMKENELCDNCKSLIIREKIDGRSTYYCKKCQK